MQPRVITRPRENFIQAFPEKPLKRKFVTTHQLQQQKKKMDQKVARVQMTSSVNHAFSNLNLPPPSPLPMFLKRNKEKVKKARCRGDADKMLPPPPPLCEYEKLKLDKMRANNEVYKSLGLPQIVSTFKDAVKSSSKSKGKKGKETTIEEDDSQYVPANEGDIESDDSSEDIEFVKQKKIDVGPRTRSRGNAAPGKSGTATESAAARAYYPQPVKPTSTKIFR
ncbi:hypothetical protein AgCh_017472 [Apium graveolens]